ncbi:MAG: tetratricopeptide repeat protein [Oscillatoria princeps RMCB-10]|nr:tetratricopeptide repeat protein [Oscillatoria princeps RMCB-10]
MISATSSFTIDGLVASSSSLGRYSRAFQLREERLKLATERESRCQELVTLRSFARLYRQVGDCPKARSFYRQAVRQGWRSGGWERGGPVAQRVESN